MAEHPVTSLFGCNSYSYSFRVALECPRWSYMAEALKQLERERVEVNSEDFRHIWPTPFEHINVYGKYEFNLAVAQQRKGVRELRRPEALNP